jgi:hypothetical protein
MKETVSRPLFVEEHGLRLLLERDGVGVELGRLAYEEGDWAAKVKEAWELGRQAKERKRQDEGKALALEMECADAKNGETNLMSGARKRAEEGREMAKGLIAWVEQWWATASTITE